GRQHIERVLALLRGRGCLQRPPLGRLQLALLAPLLEGLSGLLFLHRPLPGFGRATPRRLGRGHLDEGRGRLLSWRRDLNHRLNRRGNG
ncbi:MAG: hypothetical protein IT189_11125, partial [Microbacteriaceae bacterium]|nr:hypothetical protein [Microbacteriaceae bacterium]